MRTVRAGALDVAFHEAGPVNGPVAILLHGFPYDARACLPAARRLAERGVRSLVPFLRGYGPTRFVSGDAVRSGQQAALAADLLAFMDAVGVPRAVLAGYDWGGRAACIVAALHPERAAGLVSCGTGYNVQDIARSDTPSAAEQEARLWYQFYFHTARGARGLEENRRDVCRHLWRSWSPTWAFTQAQFAETAASFDNPDFVAVVLHSYRHRYGVVAGDPALDAMEARLAQRPTIAVPTIVLQGADDGVDPPGGEDRDRDRFTGFYERTILPGIGHNLPQEAPDAFADAVARLAGA